MDWLSFSPKVTSSGLKNAALAVPASPISEQQQNREGQDGASDKNRLIEGDLRRYSVFVSGGSITNGRECFLFAQSLRVRWEEVRRYKHRTLPAADNSHSACPIEQA